MIHHREAQQFHAPNDVVYTCLIGGYEDLNEQPVARDSSVQFICLTDDPQLKSETWQTACITPCFPADPVRSQRALKIAPPIGSILPSASRSLYIDNSVILKRDPGLLLDECLANSPLAIPTHSYRHTVLDEFHEVVRLGVDDPARVFEQLNHYTLTHPEVLDQRPYFTGMLMRNHASTETSRVMEFWRAHVLRYSRRDQLSINAALFLAGVTPHRLEIDTWGSDFHAWPMASGRNRHRGWRDPLRSLAPLAHRVRSLEQQVEQAALLEQQLAQATDERNAIEAVTEELRASLDAMEKDLLQERAANKILQSKIREKRRELEETITSRSWKMTKPFRSLHKRLFSGKRAVKARASAKSVKEVPPPSPEVGNPLSLAQDDSVVRCQNGSIIHVIAGDLRGRKLRESNGCLSPAGLAMWHALLREQQWTHVVDVGANYGEMLINSHFDPGTVVLAIEAAPDVVRCLQRTCAAHHHPITILPHAISDLVGPISFCIDRTWSGMSSVGHTSPAHHQIVSVTLQASTLDVEIQQHAPSTGRRLLCKIDVEGHELQVLRGGMQSFHSSAFFSVMVEALHADDATLEWMLARFGLEAYEPGSGHFHPIAANTAGEFRKFLTAHPQYHAQDIVLRKRVQ